MPIAHLRWNGIGGYDLADPRDQVFAFDYDGSGKLDHLVLYRPGAGTIWILKNSQGQFSAVMAEGAPGHGIGGYDLADPRDQVFAFDYDGSGKLDHLVLYRPGTGIVWALRNAAQHWGPVYETWTLPIEPTLDSAEAGLDFVNLHWTVHNPDASHVQLDWNPADTRGRHSVTGDGGFTGAGVAYLKPGTSYVFSITVQTPTGLTASTTFEVTTLSPPVRTHVPTLTGLHPSEVVSAIHAAVLDFGNVTSDAPWGATDDRIVCIGQSPAPATEVNQHTAVDITYHYIPPGPVGFSSFALHNGTSGLAVTVFRNVNHGGWEDVGALPEGKTYSQALEDGKFYWFVALDGTLPGCDGDPSNVGCQRWTTNAWIPGLGTGGPYIASV
ncbi:PASTA domain-containing protein [Terrabacter sp. 2RAF25]|uniref:PASTA domain-containing protein n=1 Tax=Terrabacter sp. 2RAF25 TaxID=3232998 RepID=UPI003F9C0CC6